MKKNKFYLKPFYIFIFLILFSLFSVMSILVFNNEFRSKLFISIIPVYNIYQTLAIRAELRNRDFEAINSRLVSHINLSKQFSKTRTTFLNGIYDNFEAAFNQAIFAEEFHVLIKSVEELLTIDPEMYMAHIWFAQANIANDKSMTSIDKSLEHINKAIELSSAREEAYRVGIKIAKENNLEFKLKNLCKKYFTSQAGGPIPRSHRNFFGGTGLSKMGIIFFDNNGKEVLSTNFGLQLNKTIEYEFNLNKKINLDNFQLIIGSLPGLKIIIEKLKLDLGSKQVTLNERDFTISSKSAYFINTKDRFNTLISRGLDDEIIYFNFYKQIQDIETITLKMNFIRLPLIKNNFCNDINLL